MSDRRVGGDQSRAETRQLRGLTGLRGIAAWWVVLYHFHEYLPRGTPSWIVIFCGRGYLAVDLFFVLSGFIIAYNYLPSFLNFGFRVYLRFLGIRLARIYPLHLFILILFLLNPIAISLVATQPLDPDRYSPMYYVMSLILIQNWGFSKDLAWNIPAWSISVEWMAYLIFPLLGWIGNKKPNSTLFAALGTIGPLILLGLVLTMTNLTLGGDIPQAGLIRCLCEFACGMFVYRLWLLRQKVFGLTVCVVGVWVIVGVLYAATDISSIWVMPAVWAGLVFLLAIGPLGIDAILDIRVLEVAGLWSYSTYLVHYFVRDWIKFILMRDGIPSYLQISCYIGITAAASGLLYYYVEIPGRRTGRQLVDRLAVKLSSGR